MKSKPAKYGIKYWCLVDVTTRYLLTVDIYLGKNSSNDKKETQVGMKAVLKLGEPYFQTKRSLTVDNFFTSLPLAQKLWAEKITLVGNVKKSFIPLCFLKSKKRKILSTMFVFQGILTLTSYVPKINKSVILLSTHHHTDSIDFDNRVNKPQILRSHKKF